MPAPPKEFPNTLCWTPQMRAEVLNTIALDVDESIFKATHYPSFVQQEGARRGKFVPLKEHVFLADFLNNTHPHVFDIAVGDTGTGKSHLIRWMYNEIKRRNRVDSDRYWLALVPRSSANLADVVRRVIQGFHGEIATRLTDELNRHHKLPLDEAKNRVIDELAYVLEGHEATLFPVRHHPTAEDKDILAGLPALLRAQELRKALVAQKDGIVTRVAKHVLGRRETREKDADLRWSETDLKFSATECTRAGEEAEELALMLLNDDRARETAVDLVNRAQPTALRKLLRFRSGDMKAALAEIRRELLTKNKQLVLLIEDLSVTEGLDAELIEALQVRTRDTGEELCKLRSIVGVTNDDYARMRENIAEGRTLRTLFFNMAFGNAGDDATVTPETVEDFASRYLNAIRHSKKDLETWGNQQGDEPLESACESCPNRSLCHESFGAVDGRGLYPLSAVSLPRLYERVSSARGHLDKAFNPRLLVGRVLNGILEEAEQSLGANEFPRASLAASFALDGVRADVQLDLQRQFGMAANRLRRTIDLYSPDPASQHPLLLTGISQAFDLPTLTWKSPSGDGSAASPRPAPKQRETRPPAAELDPFDQWLRGESVPDRELNLWRLAIQGAILAWIDWDSLGLASVRSQFKPACISIEGQFTKQKTDITLLIPRQPETAIALRGLLRRFQNDNPADSERQLRNARRQIATWSREVESQLRRLLQESGDPPPVVLAAELLTIGVLMRGASARSTTAEILCDAFLPWPEDPPAARCEAWMALWKAYKKFSDSVRELLLERLACSKGGQVGSMLDPSPVLVALKHVLTSGRPHPRPVEADKWVHYQSVGGLAKEFETHIDPATANERESCERWVRFFERAVGNTEPTELVQGIKRALVAAGAVGGLRYAGVQRFDERLIDFANQPIAERYKDAQGAISAQDVADQLSALGKLDRSLMQASQTLLTDAEKVVAASTEYIQTVKLQMGQGRDPAGLENEIQAMANEITTSLNSIAGGE
jgi:hypothetical protein